ncbi:uncharacterized protein [Penaeus vannamei]|uniref:uncharacterized protein n=1 Tax=Penaeus vannamei TaxID=6689 RepID=UPI00387F77B6
MVYSDEELKGFYDVHLASKRVKTYFTIIMGYFNAKIIINEVNVGSDHKVIRGEIKVHLRWERNKLICKPQPSLANLKIRATEFSLNIQNRYSLFEYADLNIDPINKQFNYIIRELHLKNKIELVELTKTMNKKKREDVRKFNTQIINEAVISEVITARISDSLISMQPREQAGFRSGFSTTDHIHTLT